MATPPKTTPKPAAPATDTVKVGEFEFDTGVAVPATVRGGAASELSRKIEAMPVGASFADPVAAPSDAITDASERENALKENARKKANQLSGVARRLKKANPERSYVIRTVNNHAAVRVWRNADVTV